MFMGFESLHMASWFEEINTMCVYPSMHIASFLLPKDEPFVMKDAGILNLQPWRYAKPFALFLVVFTVILYIVLGNV